MLASPVALGQDLAALPQQKPFTVTGSVDVRTIFYQARGISARRQPFSYVLSGSPTLNIYGLAVPLSFTLSEQDRQFRQPFNQFGLSPTYKWVTLHGGYRNLTYSPFTLAGHTVLGAGLELTPGKFRFGFITGRLSRATTVDPVSGALTPFSFSRRGVAGHIGVGSEKSFLDLSFVRARDDSSSVSRATRQEASKTSAVNTAVLPAENVVLGLSGKLSFAKNWLVEADGGLSVYTRNQGSRLKVEDALPTAVSNSLGRLITLNGSTETYSAWQAAAGYQKNGNGLKVRYRRVAPGYQSMGAYYFQDDVENLTLVPSFVLLKQHLRFNGSLGVQQDNLRRQKQLTSRRFIASATATVDFTERLGVDLGYSNFSTDQQPGAVQVSDTFRLAQTQQSVSVAPRYTYAGETWGHTVLLSLDRATLRDQGPGGLGRLGDFTSLNAFLTYQLTWVPRRFTVGATYNFTRLELAQGNDGNRGLQLTADQSFGPKGDFRVGLRGSWLRGLRVGQESKLLGGGLRISYRAGKHHTFRTDVAFTGNYPDSETPQLRRYSESRGEVGYTFSL
ncbi:hypothetical protein [Hymenobacter cellulosivorans]|uniref:DUF5723 domain-containing protein n=1 Tax=Hymenobacter cellulosivorans TaxID=2932249 RepID=A0ABY4FE22_9BACT|nr:hypothetical protein [Hymenobacter cellulosivorans]UOQ54844.1 hypothetical protein MUN80_08810 [Hymenobacter cellulosivorans]